MSIDIPPEQVRTILWDLGSAVALGTAIGVFIASFIAELLWKRK